MRKVLFILASIAAVGCTTTPVVTPSEHKEVEVFSMMTAIIRKGR